MFDSYREVMLSVLSAGLHQKYQTDFPEPWWKDGAWVKEELLKCWHRSMDYPGNNARTCAPLAEVHVPLKDYIFAGFQINLRESRKNKRATFYFYLLLLLFTADIPHVFPLTLRYIMVCEQQQKNKTKRNQQLFEHC